MRVKDELDSCTNRRVYRILWQIYASQKYGLCPMGWHCMHTRNSRNYRSWKKRRKTKYKVRK